MPRELVHWEVLVRAAAYAEMMGAKKVPALIAQYADVGYVGAVAHDAPYYHRGGGSAFEAISAGLHGLEKQDTFEPFRRVAREIALQKSEESRHLCWAFLCGMISHAVTDIWFHPWIFYYSGNYYHEDPVRRKAARARHRLLEVYLDAWMDAQPEKRFEHRSILTILKTLRGEELDLLCDVLGRSIDYDLFTQEKKSEEKPRHNSNLQREWRDSLWAIGWAQRAFTSKIGGFLMRVLTKVAPSRCTEFEALSSFGRARFAGGLSKRFVYQNPVTGVTIDTSLHELLNGAAEECGKLFLTLETVIDSSSESSILSGLSGSSLNYGAAGVGPKAATMFSREALDLPGMQLD